MFGDNPPGTSSKSAALEKSHVFSTAPCVVKYVKVSNGGVATAWLHVFDAKSLPANGTRPDRAAVSVAPEDVNGDTWDGGSRFELGCVAALSTTQDTLTLIATDDGIFEAAVV